MAKKTAENNTKPTTTTKYSGLTADLISRSKAAFPIVRIPEEDEIQIRKAALAASMARKIGFKAWTLTRGLMDQEGRVANDSSMALPLALDDIMEELSSEASKDEADRVGTMYLLHDLRKFIDDPANTRKLRDMVPLLKCIPSMICLVGPGIPIPPELEREVVTLHLPMPDTDASLQILKDSIGSDDYAPLNEDQRVAIVEASSGLNFHEKEVAFALAASQGDLSPANIWKQKAKVISTTELQFVENTVSLDSIGGMEIAKAWLRDRAKAYTKDAKDYGIEPPLGCVFLGPPGTGKSELCKALGGLLDMPTMRLDIGACMRPLVGESERIFREMTARCEEMRRAVIWLDEFEKMFAGGTSSGQSDGGLFLRMFSNFLTWTSERRSRGLELFLAATCNAIKNLDSALSRAGRFDQIWWIGLPNHKERMAITKIHCDRRSKSVKVDNKDIMEIATAAAGYSGAEIEQGIINAMFVAYNDNKRATNADDIVQAVRAIKPCSQVYKEELKEMERWKLRTTPASEPEVANDAGRRNVVGDTANEGEGLN